LLGDSEIFDSSYEGGDEFRLLDLLSFRRRVLVFSGAGRTSLYLFRELCRYGCFISSVISSNKSDLSISTSLLESDDDLSIYRFCLGIFLI
jgi:hypothetical protein